MTKSTIPKIKEEVVELENKARSPEEGESRHRLIDPMTILMPQTNALTNMKVL